MNSAFEGIKILATHLQENRKMKTCTRHFRQQKPCQPVSQNAGPPSCHSSNAKMH